VWTKRHSSAYHYEMIKHHGGGVAMNEGAEGTPLYMIKNTQ
jgi:hypothetical protein